MANENSEIRYLNPPTVEVRKKKYCRFTLSSSRSSSTSRARSFPAVSPVLP